MNQRFLCVGHMTIGDDWINAGAHAFATAAMPNVQPAAVGADKAAVSSDIRGTMPLIVVDLGVNCGGA